MTTPEPGRVDRASLERILQRAAELQAGEHDLGEGLTPDEVLALGKEVGIPSAYLRQAMLEDRSRAHLTEARGALDRLVGPAEISAVRVIQADEQALARALLGWMEKHELLAVQRQQPGRITWERLKGMPAYLRRGLSTFESGRAKFMLARAGLVTATVTALEPGYCQVTLTATLREVRSGILGGAAAVTSIGAAGTAVLLALNAWWLAALAPLPVAAAVAWGVIRGYRPAAERIQLGLERVLDHAEGAGVRPSHQLPPKTPGLLEVLTGEFRRALAAPRPGPRGPAAK